MVRALWHFSSYFDDAYRKYGGVGMITANEVLVLSTGEQEHAVVCQKDRLLSPIHVCTIYPTMLSKSRRFIGGHFTPCECSYLSRHVRLLMYAARYRHGRAAIRV